MPRMARLVVPEHPHHVTQRGSRKQTTFFCDEDYSMYLDLLRKHLARAGVEIWAYCLMPNHVHMVAVPKQQDSLAGLMRGTHHQYARYINTREGWQGHLWQERFHSFVMDELHLIAAVRYIELNPVRANLCSEPQEWRWSSVHAHLSGIPDSISNPRPMCSRIPDWSTYLSSPLKGPRDDVLRAHSNTGRPAGNDVFIEKLEAVTGRRLRKKNSGPPPGSQPRRNEGQ